MDAADRQLRFERFAFAKSIVGKAEIICGNSDDNITFEHAVMLALYDHAFYDNADTARISEATRIHRENLLRDCHNSILAHVDAFLRFGDDITMADLDEMWNNQDAALEEAIDAAMVLALHSDPVEELAIDFDFNAFENDLNTYLHNESPPNHREQDGSSVAETSSNNS